MSRTPQPPRSAGGMPSAKLRPLDEMTTRILPPPDGGHASKRTHGPLRFMRTLRWRLVLTYTGLLAVLLVLLGIALNVLISRLLYNEELLRFQSDATATVATAQTRFDMLINGTGADCANAISYQQAFQDSIGTGLIKFHPSISTVYLLDRYGNVLASAGDAQADGSPTVGTRGPYLDSLRFQKLRQQVVQADESAATGSIASQSAIVSRASRQQVGVVLIAQRYHTASKCVNQLNAAVGIIEVLTTFPRVQVVLGEVHLVLALSMLAVLIVGIVIGAPLAAQALRPLTRMTQTARKIGSGDLSQRVRLPHSGDEIGQLADTFDEMVARIEAAFAAQLASEERMRQFIADASHELRTPLTSIRGYTDVLLRGAKDDPETVERVLVATRRESERMSRLVEDLLTLARLDTGRPLEMRPVDLVGLTGEAVDQARILAGERNVTLQTDGGGRLTVLADADRLKQVLLVLLDNALKYGRQTPDGWVHVRIWRTDTSACLSVSDNGQGIAPSDAPHIFDRFYRAERAAHGRRPSGGPGTSPATASSQPEHTPKRTASHDGSGLGLSIAQAIVRAHAGTIAVQSELGAGTTFFVSLPLPHHLPQRS